MKKTFIILFAQLILSSALADNTVQWVGQFPKEQAGPVVELFNSKYAKDYGFSVEYTYDEKIVADMINGTANAKFDLVHTKDADFLNMLGQNAMVAPLNIEATRDWPMQLKDSDNRWIALVKRARIIYYNSELVNPADVQTYESLGNSQFEGKLCLRQKKAQYTMGLHSFFIGTWGEQKTAEVLKTWAVNSAAIPLIEKDLEGVIAGIEKGTCLVGVANTYYYTRHLAATPNTKVKAIIPNQNDIGAHINVDGIALLENSEHKTEANAFTAWLLTEEAQLLLSEITGKHPANPAVKSEKLDKIFGQVGFNTTFDINEITKFKNRALEISTEQGLK
ncbi:extracellular solute-binding protein [bacterium]|nr:extracellular solute-binding protein [bacterium]